MRPLRSSLWVDSGDVKTQLWSGVNVAAVAPDLSIKCDESSPCYPWKMGIVATVFWIGETGSGPTNARSAWDKSWVRSYGGVDDPVRRRGYRPAGFRPLENPFYAALPYCDMRTGRLKPEAAKVVPWFIEQFRGVWFERVQRTLGGDPPWTQDLLCPMGGCRTVLYGFGRLCIR